MARHAVDADDAAVSALGHLRCQRGHQLVGGAHIAVEQMIKGFGVQLGSGTEPRDATVVDQYVDLAGLLSERAHRGRVGQVGRHELGLSAVGFDLGNGGCTAPGVATMHDHGEAVTRQIQRHCATNSRCCPGHQCHRSLTVKPFHHESSY